MTAPPDDVRALFAGRNYAHVATLMPDGAPHTVPLWVDVEGDRIAHKYIGASYGVREDRVVYLVEPERAWAQAFG